MAKKKSTLLVTGGAGFIGSEFVRQAVKEGYDVSVVDKLTYAGDLERLQSVKSRIKFFRCDVCDSDKLKKIFTKVHPKIVVHFAAESHVDRSFLYSEDAIRTNFIGTQSLLEVARKSKINRFVHISTDEVYGDIKRGKFSEKDALNPSSPYSVSKSAADLLIHSYMRTYKFPAIIVRPCNSYGPWQYPEKFIPVIIYKALKNKHIPVFGNGANIREWLYVSDCVSAILTVMKKGKLREIYNVGSGISKRNIDVVKEVLKVLNRPKGLIRFVKDRPGHDFRYSLDSNKLKNQFKWKPKVSFKEGMKSTLEFYQEQKPWLEKKGKQLGKYWSVVYKTK